MVEAVPADTTVVRQRQAPDDLPPHPAPDAGSPGDPAAQRRYTAVDATAPQPTPARTIAIDDRSNTSTESGPPSRPPLRYPPQIENRRDSRALFVGAIVALLVMAALGGALLAKGWTTTTSSPPQTVDTSSGSGKNGPAQAPGIASHVSFGPNKALAVSQVVTFTRPESSIELRISPNTATVSGGSFHPTIGNILITVPGRPPITVPRSLKIGRSVRVAVPKGTTSATIVYVAYHAIRHFQHSPARQVLALVNPISVTAAGGLASTITIDGRHILNVACAIPGHTTTYCGHESARGWSVVRPAGTTSMPVLAQLVLQK